MPGKSRSVKSHMTAQEEGVIVNWASEKQREVFEYGPFPLCASGGFGSSKTWALCLKALMLSQLYPQNRGIIARKVYEQLKNTTMSTFFKICPPSLYSRGKRSDSEKYLRFNNGSEVLWMHLDDPDTTNVLRGLEINWFILDQAEEIEEEIFDILLARLGRWDKTLVPESTILTFWDNLDDWPFKNPAGTPIPPTYPMIACNPDTEFHWIYRRFHPDSLEHQTKYSKQGYKMWRMSSEENRFLPKQNLDALLSQDEAFIRRFVRGEWGIPEGQIHHIQPESIIEYTPDFIEHLRSTCTLYRSLDHGDAAPTCCIWWAVDHEGNVCAYREYYQPNRLISEHRTEITSLSQYEHYTMNLADPSIFHLTMQKYGGRWSVSDEYGDVKNLPRNTALFWIAADNNELGTRNRINEYLRVDPDRIHPVTKQRGSPRLFFIHGSEQYTQGCNYLLRETRAQRRIKVGTDLGKPIFSDDRDPSIPDHAYDCTSPYTAITYSCDGITWTKGIMLNAPKSGFVLTPWGPQWYSDLQCYHKNAQMVRVNFKDGQSVIATPDHLFLTNCGWRKAQDLKGSLCLSLSPLKMAAYSLGEEYIIPTTLAVTGLVTPGGFIERFLRRIMGLSQGVCSSIMRMGIRAITQLKTLSQLIEDPMHPCIIGAYTNLLPLLPYERDSRSLSGPLLEGHGLSSTLRTMSWLNSIKGINSRTAWIAGNSSLQQLLPLTEPNAASLVTIELDSKEIDSVVPAPSEDAWCLTVHHPSAAFCIEDGLVVHNCLRYFISSRPAIMHSEVGRIYGRNTFEGKRRQLEQLNHAGGYAWMAREAKKQTKRYAYR